MKRPRLQSSRIALDLSAWRALDNCAPGAMTFAVPGLHSFAPFEEASECPSGHAGTIPQDPFSAPDPDAMGLPGWQHPPRPHPIEYRIGLRLTNISATVARFDKIVLGIHSSTGFGRGFSATLTHGGKESPKIRIIRPGETLEEASGTGGYTENLLGESGGRPLLLDLTMLLRGGVVEAWHAQLPALPDLPRFDRDHFSPNEEIPQGSRRLHVPSLADN